MTIQAAKLLDEAWELFYGKIAREPDGSPISRQSPSWGPPSTPYDYASLLVKSLIAHTYNLAGYPTGENQEYVNVIYDAMIDCGQVITLEEAEAVINEYINGGRVGYTLCNCPDCQ